MEEQKKSECLRSSTMELKMKIVCIRFSTMEQLKKTKIFSMEWTKKRMHLFLNYGTNKEKRTVKRGEK